MATLGEGMEVTVVRAVISEITATGVLSAGVMAAAGAVVTDSSITDLTGTGTIGVYVLTRGTITVTRSTVARLTGAPEGFGVSAPAPASVVTIVNSTISTVTGPAAGSGGTATIVYSTISGTGSSASAPYRAQILVNDALTLFGAVVVQNAVGGPNCEAGSTASVGYNFADDTTCGLTGTGDHQGVGLDALLGTLADNGGPGLTRLPRTGSPLLDAIPAAACQTGPAAGITTDERGLPRPALDGCDIGAAEVQPEPVVPRFTG